MKKILVIAALVISQSASFASSYMDRQLREVKKNQEYSSTKIHTKDYQETDNFVKTLDKVELKDPKLIKISNVTPIYETAYQKKLAADEEIYKNKIKPAISKKMDSVNIEPAAIDFYNVYRISEKLIRANKLDYVNWRITIRKAPDDFNADASAGNHININTALYDSLYNNDDALAFCIAHEMAHLLLGHTQRLAEIKTIMQNIKRGDSNDELADAITDMYFYSQVRAFSNEIKDMEYIADAEACNLLVKAGYSPSKAMDALSFLNTLQGANIKYLVSTHPLIRHRINNVLETFAVVDPNWVEEGKQNIYNSKVLDCKKSSDRVSIVLYTTKDLSKKYYEPEDIETKLTRIAYMSYLRGNFREAKKYFLRLTDINKSYVPYLYLSYTEENIYKQTGKRKHLKFAIKAIEKASELNPNETNIIEQKESLQKVSIKDL